MPHHIKQRMTFRRLIFIAIAAIGFRLVLQTCLMSVGLVSGFCSSGQSFAASFFPTLRRRNAVAFGCALPAIRARSGLAPVRTYTCRAYQKREPRSVSLQAITKKGTGIGSLVEDGRRLTFPQTSAVSSARAGLTSLFGMGRGEHRLYNHPNNGFDIWNKTYKRNVQVNVPTESLRVISTARL